MTTTTAPDYNAISICADCVSLLANSHVTDGGGNDITAEQGDAVTAVWGEGWQEFLALGGEEEGFSWASCDGCGSTLGGDRFTAHYDANKV